tara:strand:+ start:1228 stop:2550 length:1323 start_codon:yes stop_codon:yes gene_type:complete
MNLIQPSRNIGVGTATSTQMIGNVSLQPYMTTTYSTLQADYIQNDDDMEGEGVIEKAQKILSVGKKVAKVAGKAADIYSGSIGTAVKNLIPSSDENARPSFKGEKHAVLQLPNGKMGIANWTGPGTQVVKRAKRGDKGRTATDGVSMRHDIDFTLAADAPTKKEQLKLVRQADERMINSMNKIARDKADTKFNIALGRRAIQAKVMAENAGILSRDKFAGALENISDGDKMTLLEARGQSGYGMLPADVLKMNMRKMMKKNKKGGALSLAGGSLSLAGQGKKGGSLKLAGGAVGLMSIFWWVVKGAIALSKKAIARKIAAKLALAAATRLASKISGEQKGKGLAQAKAKVQASIKKTVDNVVDKVDAKSIDMTKTAENKLKAAIEKLQKSGKATEANLMKLAKQAVPAVKSSLEKNVIKTVQKGGALRLAGQGLKLAGMK